MNTITIVTLFEAYFEGLRGTGVVGQALRGERGALPEINFLNPSDFNDKGFKGVDASPYGGGAGQVMRGDVLESCLFNGLKVNSTAELKQKYKIIYLGPRGETFNQVIAQNISDSFLEDSNKRELVFICGRYEGVDERFLELYVDQTISLGDFVLSGGEVALTVILDAAFRLCRGVLSNSNSPVFESFSDGLLEYPQYTKPQFCCDKKVPDVLLSGNHQKIATWRQEQKLLMTKKFRDDLYKSFLQKERK